MVAAAKRGMRCIEKLSHSPTLLWMFYSNVSFSAAHKLFEFIFRCLFKTISMEESAFYREMNSVEMMYTAMEGHNCHRRLNMKAVSFDAFKAIKSAESFLIRASIKVLSLQYEKLFPIKIKKGLEADAAATRAWFFSHLSHSKARIYNF